MKHTILVKKEIEIKTVVIWVPVRYGEDDIPNDFPGRERDNLTMVVEIDTGKIVGWPQGKTAEVYMKVTDGGCYYLMDESNTEVASIEQDYVPDLLIPGDYGDYIKLQIDGTGTITNWPKEPDVTQFFNHEEE